MSTQLLLWAHLPCIAFFAAGQFYYLVIIAPASRRFFTVNEQIRFLENIITRHSPVLLLALCLAVVSGGLMITPLKGELGAGYFDTFGPKLIEKLGLFFLVFFTSAYQALSVGFSLRALDPAGMSANAEAKLNGIRLRLTLTSVIELALMLVIVWRWTGGS